MHDVYRQVAHELSGASLAGQGQLRLKVTSHSMSPLLRPGDHVLVQAVSSETLQRGDLLVTQRMDDYLTHRLVAVNELGWHTKGDRNRRADAPISAQFITGLVVAVERRGHTRNIRTRPRRLVARFQGWLGWKEANSNSRPGTWLARLISRTILVLAFI
jgi:signal peptidase I